MGEWAAWRLDFHTWAWIVWIAAFFVLEFHALWFHKGQELTEHLRPILQSGGGLSPIYYMTLGLWVWLLIHFWVDGLFVNKSG